jgi:hypothetical protein
MRISVCLMAAAGAFSLSVAEGSLGYLIAVLVFGGAAHITVDSGRMRPLRVEHVCPLALLLLFYTMLPLREEQGWDRHFPAAFAHFLCALQVLFFFTANKGSVLLTVWASTLAIVLISGVMQPDVSLLPRLACFIAVTVWMLFVHALWRAREAFNVQALSAALPGGAADGGKKSGAAGGDDMARLLPERAIWQGIGMSLGIAAACLILGLLLFFAVPRIHESISGLLENLTREPAENASLPTVLQARSGSGGAKRGLSAVGWNPHVALESIGITKNDHRLAFSVAITPLMAEAVTPDGRIYFRGAALSEHLDDAWSAPDDRRVLETSGNSTLIHVSDTGSQKTTPPAMEFKQQFEIHAVLSNEYFALGDITRVEARKIVVDSEGSVRALSGGMLPETHTLWSRPPVFEHQVPADAIAEHDDRQRYVRNTGLAAAVVEDVRRLALQITENDSSAPAKARGIVAHLHDKRRYTYDLQATGVRIDTFLLNKDAALRRGRCAHFAAAFVLLCRLNNLPARMATGFAAAARPSEWTDGTVLNVRNSDAHAWGEVFFKGIGWVAFDPTPPGSGEETGPEIAAKPPEPKTSGETVEPMPQRGALSRAWDNLLAYDSRDQRALYQRLGDALGRGTGGARAILGGKSGGGWLVALLAWLLLIVTLCRLVAVFLRRGVRRFHGGAQGWRNSRAAIAFYNDLLHALSRRGFTRRPGQTPREFAEQVVRRGGEAFKPVLVVTEVFENMRYGGGDLSQEEFNTLQNALDNLRDLSFGAGVSAPKS